MLYITIMLDILYTLFIACYKSYILYAICIKLSKHVIYVILYTYTCCKCYAYYTCYNVVHIIHF